MGRRKPLLTTTKAAVSAVTTTKAAVGAVATTKTAVGAVHRREGGACWGALSWIVVKG